MQTHGATSKNIYRDVSSIQQAKPTRRQRACSILSAAAATLITLLGFEALDTEAAAPAHDSNSILAPTPSESLIAMTGGAEISRHVVPTQLDQEVEECLKKQTPSWPGSSSSSTSLPPRYSTWVNNLAFTYQGQEFQDTSFYSAKAAERQKILDEKKRLWDEEGSDHKTNYVFVQLGVIYDTMDTSPSTSTSISSSSSTATSSSSSTVLPLSSPPPSPAASSSSSPTAVAATSPGKNARRQSSPTVISSMSSSSAAIPLSYPTTTSSSSSTAATSSRRNARRPSVPTVTSSASSSSAVTAPSSPTAIPLSYPSVTSSSSSTAATFSSRNARRPPAPTVTSSTSSSSTAIPRPPPITIPRPPPITIPPPSPTVTSSSTSTAIPRSSSISSTSSSSTSVAVTEPLIGRKRGSVRGDDDNKTVKRVQTRYVYKPLTEFLSNDCFNSGRDNKPIAGVESKGWGQGFGNEGTYAKFLSPHLKRKLKAKDIMNSATTLAHSEPVALGALLKDAESCDPDGPKEGSDDNCALYQAAIDGGWKDHLSHITAFTLKLISIPNSVCNSCDTAILNSQFVSEYAKRLKLPKEPKLIVTTTCARAFLFHGHISCAGLNYREDVIPAIMEEPGTVILHMLPMEDDEAESIREECGGFKRKAPCVFRKS